MVVGCCGETVICGISPVNCHQANNVVTDIFIMVTQKNETYLNISIILVHHVQLTKH